AWSIAFGLLAILISLCGVLSSRSISAFSSQPSAAGKTQPSPRPTLKSRLLWLVLALIPSSLTLGVTQFLSTDVAAVPLLSVVPPAIYLLTFIIAFSRPPPLTSVSKLLPIAVVAVAMTFFIRGFHLPALAFFALHLVTL